MKKDIHNKEYRLVLFLDTSNDEEILVHSSVETDKTKKWSDGKEYPLYEVEISSSSHPFYTGNKRIVDTAGRAEKFRKRMAKKVKALKKKTVKVKEVTE